MQRVPSNVRSQFGRNFVSSFHSFSLSFPPSPPPLHKLNQDERTSFVRPFRCVLLLSFSWEEGEMDARCERQRWEGRKERGEGEPGEK